MPVVETLIEKVKQLDFENARKIDDFDVEDRKEWKKRTESGEAKAVQNFQEIGTNILDPSWGRTGVEYVAYYDMDKEGNKRELRMVSRKILQGKRTTCYKKNEASKCIMGRHRGSKLPTVQVN